MEKKMNKLLEKALEDFKNNNIKNYLNKKPH